MCIDFHTCILHRNASNFSAGDSFVGYQADTPASIVFKVFQEVDFTKFSDNSQWEKEVCTIPFCICYLCI